MGCIALLLVLLAPGSGKSATSPGGVPRARLDGIEYNTCYGYDREGMRFTYYHQLLVWYMPKSDHLKLRGPELAATLVWSSYEESPIRVITARGSYRELEVCFPTGERYILITDSYRETDTEWSRDPEASQSDLSKCRCQRMGWSGVGVKVIEPWVPCEHTCYPFIP